MLSPARTKLCLALLVLLGFSLGCSEFVVIGIESDLATELGISLATAGQLISVFALIYAIGIIIPFTSFGRSIGLTALPLGYFLWLPGILLSYCILTQLVKSWYIRKFARWL